jgi:DNA-binding response OmpR family regulator
MKYQIVPETAKTVVSLVGLRVLVVEDEAMICLLLEDMLTDFGCEILGPASDIDQAAQLAGGEQNIDVALLDVNLGGRPIFPVAKILLRRSVPILFATGLGVADLPRDWQTFCWLQKPMTSKTLADALDRTLRQRIPTSSSAIQESD